MIPKRRHQRTSQNTRAYTTMVRAIDKERKRYRWLIPAGFIALLVAGLIFVIALAKGQLWWQAALGAGNGGWLTFVGILLIVLALEVLNHGDNVDKSIDVALAFLHEANYNEPTLVCIKERAQTAGTAATLRTMLPIVAVPIGLGVLVAQNAVPTDLTLLGWGLVAMLVGSMLVELLRGSTAFIVLDALAEFRCEQATAQTPVAQTPRSGESSSNGSRRNALPYTRQQKHP